MKKSTLFVAVVALGATAALAQFGLNPAKSAAAAPPTLLPATVQAATGSLAVGAAPLMPPRVARVQLPPEDSAAVAAQKRLGDRARVVAAFHNVAALKLQKDMAIDCDVLVFGDDVKDRETVIALAQAAGLRGLHGGPLANSTATEALTSVLIGINRTYKVDGAGIRITGIAQG